VNSERSRLSDVVRETRGQILIYEGEVLPAFYHATCGGQTRPAWDLWNYEASLVPLQGVRCSSCWFSPHFGWRQNLSRDQLEKALGGPHQSLQDMTVASRTTSGRVQELKLLWSDHEETIQAKDFRMRIGPQLIRSDLFDLKQSRGQWTFEGRGWGHGVGLCQWGALGLAIVRSNYVEILSHYYPEAELETIY